VGINLEMRYFKIIGIIIWGLLTTIVLHAQSKNKQLKVAVFAPIYLDSTFDGPNYKLGNANLPKLVLPGLDFYNGISLAIDSLNAEHQSLEVLFFDTKSNENPIELILDKKELQDVSLIIAAFNSRSEIKTIADFALEKNIPLVSMTYPNDGGITGNPFFALVNPTLKTHIDAIYKFIHKTYPINNITIFKRKGATEDMIAGSLNELNKKTPGLPLKIKTIELTDTFTSAQVLIHLDSTKENTIICASLNEAFGNNLVKSIASSKKYKAVTVGMPTWDAIKDIGKDAEIIYSTPYNYSRTDKIAQQIITNYRNKYFGRPSDMVFKGFEAMYHFGKLLIAYDKNLLAHLSDKSFKLFNDFDFQPVKQKNESAIPDYLENKKLYFIRKLDTQIKSVN
jgi:ABC-type branched-subunit amino acid transport system substrate-binding protein